MTSTDEERDVLVWRLLCLGLMGYDLDAANEIANSDADLWEIRRLLADGATHELATAIAV